MHPKKCLVIYFAPNYLRRCLLVHSNSPDNAVNLEEDEIVELYANDSMYSSPTKPFSKREQFQILDRLRDWLKDIEKKNKSDSAGDGQIKLHTLAQDKNLDVGLKPDEKVEVKLLAANNLQSIEGVSSILESLKAQFGIEPIYFSSHEAARQAFIGAKPNLVNYRQNSRLVHLSLEKDKTILVLGDFYRQDKSIQIDFGIQQVAETIATLRKSNQLDSLILFVKANLYRFIEKARFFGKPQLVTFDDHSARLLTQSLSVDQRAQRVNAEWIQQLCSKVIDSDFQYLNSSTSWVSTESLDYTSAHLILLSFLLEGLGANVCSLDKDCRLRGYVLDQLIEDNHELAEQYIAHQNDWKRSAQETLIRLNPLDFSRASQIALLANKIFSSTHGWLHLWSPHDYKILWLSALFSGTLSKQSLDVSSHILSELEGINRLDCQIIASTIGLSCTSNLSLQSKYLDTLPAENRGNVRKMASVIQLAKALDVTGRSAVQDLKVEAKPKSPDKAILKIFPRLNANPELIQVEVLKRSFENQFEQKLELEIASNKHVKDDAKHFEE